MYDLPFTSQYLIWGLVYCADLVSCAVSNIQLSSLSPLATTWRDTNVNQCWRTLLDSCDAACWLRDLRFLRKQTHSFPNLKPVERSQKFRNQSPVLPYPSSSYVRMRAVSAWWDGGWITWGWNAEAEAGRCWQMKGVDQLKLFSFSQPFPSKLRWWSLVWVGCFSMQRHWISSPWSWPFLD